ncbi:UNVERIFIED_CONTAM: hypothetical protein RMT77_007740 [Armadillidium vulgare]
MITAKHQNAFGKAIDIDVSFISNSSAMKSVKIHIKSKSLLQLPSWIMVTLAICLIGFVFKLHEYHPLLLSSAIFIQLLILAYRIHVKVISEILLIVYGLGIQSTTEFYTGKYKTKFIPWCSIKDIVIPETVTMQQVVYFMAILLKSNDCCEDEKLVPIFLNSWPRLKSLVEIYRHCSVILR